jgi:type VI secretion system protein ImpA
MSAEPLLAFDELVAPIPGDNPAGEPVAYPVRAEMEEARKEVNLEDFDEKDPLRPTEAKKADWKGLIRQSTETLTSSSKDLLVAARLTEALTKLHGFAGLADGLHLMRLLVAECWDRLFPLIEDGDLEVRAGPFNWLGDDGRGARFPYTLRSVPLFKSDDRWYDLRDWKLATEGKGKVTREQYEKAINAAPREQCQQLVDDLTRSVAEFQELLGVLNQHLGSVAPSMTDTRNAVMEALTLANQVLQRKGPPPAEASADAEAADGQEGASAQTSGPLGSRMVSRDDIYKRLSEAADLLERMEPHSPVPYLIRRAIAWGAMPFPLLMKALIREDYAPAITEMNRELGIKEEPAAQ